MKRAQHSMLEGPLLPSIISYTIPIILTSVLQLLFNAADLVVIGQYCGSISVAAVGATGSLTSLLVNFFVGLSVGAGSTMANAIGSRNNSMVHRIVHTAMPTALICGTVLTVIGVAFSEIFLIWMGTPKDVLALASVYMRIYFGGILFTMVYNFCAAILRAAGDTKSPLLFLSLSGVVNVLLNLLFVTVFDMNVAGVALATTISQGVAAALTVLALMKRTDACRLQLRKMRFFKEPLMKIIGQGIPAGMQSSLFSISNVLIQSSINSFGEVVISGNAAAVSIEGFVYVGMNAFYQTAINFTGQNIGAQQYQRVRKILWSCLGCVMVFGAVFGSMAYLLAPQLLGIYITDSVQAIQYGIIRITFVCLTQFLCGMMEVCTGVLRGMQFSILPMVITVLGACGFRVAWIYTVFRAPQFHSLESLYISYPISWILTFSAELIACLWLYRKRFVSQGICKAAVKE